MENVSITITNECFSDFIALVELIIEIVALIIGGIKVFQFFDEYKAKKFDATFGYYANLRVYIKRLRNLTTTNNIEPLGNIFLLSANEHIQKKGFEDLAKELSDLSNKFLDYLCLKSEQIPIAESKDEAKRWNNLIDTLSNYLTDFILYDTGAYVVELSDEECVKEYHKKFLKTLDAIDVLINDDIEKIWGDIEASKSNF